MNEALKIRAEGHNNAIDTTLDDSHIPSRSV